MTEIEYFLVFLAAIGAGLVNALAGGGTLITFPTLTFLGIPPLVANVTNTVALLPGYLGGTMAQSKDLQGQRRRLYWFIPAGLLGGLIGGILLLNTGEKLFSELVPYLILLASLLLAIQDPVKKWLNKRPRPASSSAYPEAKGVIPVALASIYGGYFGAGLSVIILSVLGLSLDDNMTRLNALKQVIAFSANIAAALFFAFSGKVIWSVALVMMIGALMGGWLGGKLARRIKPSTLRWLVVTIGVIVAVIYLIRQ